MTDDDFDDLDLTPDDESDDHVRLSKADVKRMRSAARRAGAAEKELAAYKRQDSVRKAGIEGLSERQINAIAREAGEDDSPDKLREIAVEFGWAQAPEPSAEDAANEAEIAGQTEAAAISTGAEPPAQRTQLAAQDIAAWPVDKRMRLLDQHPDIHELALRGEPITLPAGFN